MQVLILDNCHIINRTNIGSSAIIDSEILYIEIFWSILRIYGYEKDFIILSWKFLFKFPFHSINRLSFLIIIFCYICIFQTVYVDIDMKGIFRFVKFFIFYLNIYVSFVRVLYTDQEYTIIDKAPP